MTFHRVRIYEQGEPSVLKYEAVSEPLPPPGPGQARIRHSAIGVNFIDTMFRDGTFPAKLPFDMGIEAAGVIEEIAADVQDLAVGDKISYFLSPGSYADTRLIDAGVLIKLPDDVAPEVAAALTTKGLTAWMLLKRVHPIKPQEVVLVHGATGAVGHIVVRWAKALGAAVIATVSSADKIELVRAAGVENVLATDDPDLVRKVRALSGGSGVDVVYDFVGKATIDQSITVLKDGGHLVHVGNASGQGVVDPKVLQARRLRYTKPATAQYVNDKASLAESSAEVFSAYRNGVFGEISPRRYPLAEVVKVHEDIAARRIAGPAIMIP